MKRSIKDKGNRCILRVCYHESSIISIKFTSNGKKKGRVSPAFELFQTILARCAVEEGTGVDHW